MRLKLNDQATEFKNTNLNEHRRTVPEHKNIPNFFAFVEHF